MIVHRGGVPLFCLEAEYISDADGWVAGQSSLGVECCFEVSAYFSWLVRVGEHDSVQLSGKDV
jgi:hypothetical protein